MTDAFTLRIHRDVSVPFDPIVYSLKKLGPGRCVGDSSLAHERHFTLLIHRDLDDSEGLLLRIILEQLSSIGPVAVVGDLPDGHRLRIPRSTFTGADEVDLVDCDRYGEPS